MRGEERLNLERLGFRVFSFESRAFKIQDPVSNLGFWVPSFGFSYRFDFDLDGRDCAPVLPRLDSISVPGFRFRVFGFEFGSRDPGSGIRV
jgi:hypothetical protein